MAESNDQRGSTNTEHLLLPFAVALEMAKRLQLGVAEYNFGVEFDNGASVTSDHRERWSASMARRMSTSPFAYPAPN